MAIIAQGASAPTIFTFTSKTLRVVMRDGEPWFVAADVCAALTIGNSRMATDRLDDDEKGVSSIDTPSGEQQMTVINESGLYSLILGSRKPEAKKFKKWVTSEVLPAIRKTGAYIHTPAMRPGLTTAQKNELSRRLHVTTCAWCFTDSAKSWVYNHLRVAFQVARWEDIPTEHFGVALALADSKQEAARQFLDFLLEARDWFERECLGAGTPWTPAIQRKLTQELGRRVILPPKVDWLALAHKTEKTPEPSQGATA